jgi:hypothetical protein
MIDLVAGVTYNEDDTFTFNFDEDSPSDIVSLAHINVFEGKTFPYTYFYGYEFNENVPSKVRTEFISQIKGLKETKITPQELLAFYCKPILLLGSKLHAIDVVLYPRSARSEINRYLVKYISDFAIAPSKNYVAFELIKNHPSKIQFDWELFDSHYLANPKYEKFKREARKLINRINSMTGYFSLAKEVPSHSRNYITNYLNFEPSQLNEIAAKLNDANVLIVDDINTTSSTILNMLKTITTISIPKTMTIFTLLGKDYTTLIGGKKIQNFGIKQYKSILIRKPIKL